MSLKRLGLISTTSGTVDNLTYGYQSNSNQLDHVNDPNGTTAKLGDFKDGHTTAGDYSYDANGNLKKDLNKGISSITYNYLNLPETITFSGKGTIKFVYDATGNKLQKIVTDQSASPTKTTTIDYINGFVYQNDTLQFFPTEEGRVRYVPAHGSTAAAYVYDYFIKDHLGNTRVVLTEQTDFTQYLATMEPEKAQTEDALFYNLNSTREAKPADYPQDNITTPNTAVAKLNGKDPDKRIGPSIILKVMAGDTIQAAVRAFYRKKATPKNNAGLPGEQILAGLLQAFVTPGQAVAQTHVTNPQARMANPQIGITSNDLASLKQKEPDNQKENKPKAYLNYVFFDKQFNFVDNGSGVKQVDGEPGQLETLASGKVVAKKNGYVYVYTSNESQQDVLFDNMSVMDITGPVLEETHYYPFGLTMAGISTKAPLKLEGKRKFNGIEFNHKEFSDGSELDLYTAKFRGLDPQIGRWWQIDPRPNFSESPYAAMGLNPIINTDFLGDTINFSSAQITDQKTVDQTKIELGKETGLTLKIDKSGKMSYATTLNKRGKVTPLINRDSKGNLIGSKSARKDLMKAINSKKTIIVFAVKGKGSQGGGLQINLDATQINKFMSGVSSDLNKLTMGYGITFLHELEHTSILGSKSDPATMMVNGKIGVPFGQIGSDENRINKIRRELNRQGFNLGQRMSYGPLPLGKGGKVYMPFDTQSLQDITNGIVPTKMVMSYIP